jgi:lactate dehydrogenase-like 2-hydroxyacid dehydrogenase
MKIGVLNESFLKKEHLDALKKIGNVEVLLDTTDQKKAIERIRDKDIIVVDMFLCPLNKAVLESANKLKLICLNTTGFDKVDLNVAKKRGVKVANLPNYATDAVAEHAIALLFAALRKIPLGDRECRKEFFDVDPANKEQMKYIGSNVRGKTLGVIGFGAIGKRVAELALGLGMKVVAYNRTPRQFRGVEFKELDEVLKTSDFISLNLALTPDTTSIINEKRIKLLKKDCVLINVGRAGLIATEPLYSALKVGKIRAAALDVINAEKNHEIFSLENVVFSPHSAWFTEESLATMANMIVNNIKSFVEGKPVNLVN